MSFWTVKGQGPLSHISGQYNSAELHSVLIAELEIQGSENVDTLITGLRDDGRGLYSGSQLLAAVGSELS